MQSVTPYRGEAAPTPVVIRRGGPKPFRARELLTLAGLVAITDVAFYGKGALASGGFGFALFFLVVPIALVAGIAAVRKSTRLFAGGALLALVGARCAFDPSPGAILIGLGLLFFFAMGLRQRQTFAPQAIAAAFKSAYKLPTTLASLAVGAYRIVGRTRVGQIALAPILVPIALCAVFGGVFALANPVVASVLGTAWGFVFSIIAVPSAARVFLWFCALLGAASLLRPATHLVKAPPPATIMYATPVSLQVARNALFALNGLFLLYNALDAAYLWSGAPPAGMQTRHYAHAGAFWLTIALVMLTGVIGVMFRGALAHDARAARSRTLAYVWMAQGLFLALGTYRRIAIHVAFSGLSDLRIVGILGTTLVVVGVVLVLLKLRDGRSFTWLLRRQLDAFAITLALYAVFPTHLVSARFNVARIESGEYRPVLHMFRQSTESESAASLLPLLSHPDVRVRQGVATLLEAESKRLHRDLDRQASWREHDLASAHAVAELDAAAPQIAEVLGTVDRDAAREVLLEISRVANERTLEELLTVPTATELSERGEGGRRRPSYE